MKRISLIILIVSISVIGFCGNGDGLILPLTPTEVIMNCQSEVEGPLKEYLYVANDKYKFEIIRDSIEKEIKFQIDVKFVMYHSGNIKAGRGYNNYGPNLEMKFSDKEGKPLLTNRRVSCAMGYQELSNKIKEGENNEEWIQFTGSSTFMYQSQEELTNEIMGYIKEIQRISQFEIISRIVEEEFESSSSEISVKSTPSSFESSSSSSCDEFLDSYDAVMTKYITAVKKYQKNPNDMALLTKQTEILSDLSEWETLPTDCEGDPSFMAKLLKIQAKQTMNLSNY